MTVVEVSGVSDFAALGVRWRELEQRAAPSFFQSWSWVGCLVAERFADPVLVAARDGGRTVALALFNRVRRFGGTVLVLGASGDAELDCPYVEQNGVLAEAGREAALTELCLRAVAGRHGVVLPAVGDAVVAAVRRAGGMVWVARSQGSPFVDLDAVRRQGGDYLAGLSANTRQQIRRSDRCYGAVAVERAGTVAAAWGMLDEMAVLHQAAWEARGQAGCFARPFFRRFHRALIERALGRGEVAVLRVASGGSVIGILYNFQFRRGMLAYQSGFAYGGAERRAKPGLTCHHAGIRFAVEQGCAVYDFLAGEGRYKLSLADGSYRQNWVESGGLWSVRLLLRAGLARWRDRGVSRG